MKDLKYWIWISRLNISPKDLKNCLTKYSPSEIWRLKEKKLSNFFTPKGVYKILDVNLRNYLEEYEKYIKKYGIQLLTVNDYDYPAKLKEIIDSPIVLYALGNIELLKKRNIAIVGSRECTEYGKHVSEAFSYLLAKNDFVITSGLAKGIDSAAHKGCLYAKGNTIAVVGTGLDIVYPKENKELMSSIINNNGLVLSEFPLGTKPSKLNFPKRNRIISAISDGVLVVEAAEKSGALITVDFALDYGKNIYAVPGSILSSSSKGTNELIKDGAKMVTNIKDILVDF